MTATSATCLSVFVLFSAVLGALCAELSLQQPITKATLVVPLPPMFSVATFCKPSTW